VYHFHPRLYPIPIYDYAEANEELVSNVTEVFMNVVGRAFVEGAFPPSVHLESREVSIKK
jgi:hypothetical protein